MPTKLVDIFDVLSKIVKNNMVQKDHLINILNSNTNFLLKTIKAGSFNQKNNKTNNNET
jgi:hypothetical protein